MVRILVLVLAIFIQSYGNVSSEQFHCNEKDGVKICVSFHGSSSFAGLIPEEKNPVKLNIFYVRIENNSMTRLTVMPSYFSCVNLVGEAFAIDPPLYDKIKWAKKLAEAGLDPGRKTEGYIFCPGTRYPIRTVVYQGEVILEISLF